MIITISGKQGAGKTTLAKNLAKKLNYKFLSIGDLKGIMAQERGMTIDEFSEMGKKDPKTVHELVDEKTKEIGKTEDNFIIEGWIAWKFIPHSKKIFLEVEPKVGAKRVFADQRPDEDHCEKIEEMELMLKERLKTTNAQFIKNYGIKFLDKTQYDIIVDTTHLTIEEMINIILKKLK